MQFKKLLIILLLSQLLRSKTLKEYRDDYCKGIDYEDLETSLTSYEDLRSERDNPFHKEYVTLIKFLHGEDSADVIEATLPYFVLLLIFLIFVFIFFVVTILLLLNVIKNLMKKNKIWKILFFVFFFIFFVLFIVFCVYLGLMFKAKKKGLCIYFRTVHNLLDGDSTLGSSSYLGLFTMEKMDKDFITKIPKIPEMENTNKKIFTNVSLGNYNQMFDSLSSVKTTFQDRKTTDMISSQSKPISLQKMNETINTQIGSEFQNLYKTAYTLNQSAEKALNFSNSFYRDTATQIIGGTNLGLQVLNAKLRESFIDRIDDSYKFTKFSGYGNLFLIIFMIIFFILLCLLLVSIFKENLLKRKVRIIILIVTVVFLMGATIASFFVLFGSASFSGFCEYAARINRGEIDVLEKVEAIDSITLMTLTCFLDTSKGLIIEQILKDPLLINVYNHYRAILDGIKNFELYEKNYSSLNSPAIDAQLKSWEEIQNGFQEDHLNVNNNLEELNDLISCSDKKFEISKAKCLSEANCQSILETATYSTPSCASDSALVQTLFTKLKKYSDETNILINELKAQVGSQADTSTLYGQYSNNKNNLISEKNDVAELKKNLESTFSYIDDFNSDFTMITDCRNLRAETLRLEDYACFRFSYYYYIFLVVSMVLLVLGFVLVIIYLFYNLQKEEGEVVNQRENEDEEDKKFYKNNEQEVVIDTNERMPGY